ncbi:MAG: acyl-CoA thioesterase [Gammaproteobacteria bacterium]|nr:acyl-CoA thioesterase [Gammaproteobacteria bacterium]
MTQKFSREMVIPLQDIDAAGVVFFAHLFRYAHETYEAFMSSIEHPLNQYIKEGKAMLPLVHAEADYKLPLTHAQKIEINLSVKSISEHSFTLDYQCINENGKVCAEIQTVHVTVDPANQQSMVMPDNLRQSLLQYY